LTVPIAKSRARLTYLFRKTILLLGTQMQIDKKWTILATPIVQLLAIVKRVESPWFGVNLDSGNFQTADPYGDLAKIAPYAINAQIKSEISPNGKKQDADLARIVGILRDAGYRGYVVLEYEAAEEPKTAIPRHIETLRKLIRA